MDLATVVRQMAPQPDRLPVAVAEDLAEQLCAKFPGDDAACVDTVFFVSGCADCNDAFVAALKTPVAAWEHPLFEEYARRLEQEDRRYEDPYPVTEGAIRCFKCGQWKTQSFSLQLRGGDESMTVFVRCVTCAHNWTM